MSSYSCGEENESSVRFLTPTRPDPQLLLSDGDQKTDLVFRQVHVLHVALVRFAVGQLPQLLRRLLIQLAADLFVLPSVGEVVRREAAVVGAVDVGAEAEEAADQCGVLEVHGQVERRPAAALFLRTTTTTTTLAVIQTSNTCCEKVHPALRGPDAYLCVDVGAEPNEVLNQRHVAVNGRQVETVVSWEEQKQRRS